MNIDQLITLQNALEYNPVIKMSLKELTFALQATYKMT